MSGSSSFSGTITGGVQDISALLPLLGTEQCENHVGSALENGYLYSSVTPLSIFGSLGIVRAAFNILFASLSIRRFRFLGATKLSDGGFTPNGVVAPMIALDPKHPKRFLAETRLEEMLAEEHIENVEDLTVSWKGGIWWWNSRLILFSSVISLAALVPYVAIILDGPRVPLKTFFPLGFGFPILRVVGSALCVNVAQFLLQLRILVILKTRILFIAIDRLVKEEKEKEKEKEKEIPDLESMINHRQQGGSPWTSDVASERCIWALRTWLASDTENREHHSKVNTIYESERDRQKMKPLNDLIPPWVNVLLVFFLFLGGLSTVIGYVGCFYLIQQATSSKGPLLWLGLEALLSLIRIFVWALNPPWDDSKGIVFELQLALHPPLITCNKSQDDIVDDHIAPLMRSNSFLKDVVAFTGPLLTFVVPDVTLYYILTAKGRSNDGTRPPGVLYLVLSDQKEQTSRVLYKERPKGDFHIFISALDPVPGSTAINAKVDLSEKGGMTDHKTHFLTSDPVFMTQLGAHYNEITQKMQMQRSNTPKAIIKKTWAMHQPSKDDNGDNGGQPATNHQESNPVLELTAEDMAYLRQGQLERRWHYMYSQFETWIGLLLALYTKELLEDVPNVDSNQDTSMKAVQEYEANEVEFLIIECSRILELCLISTARQWDKSVKTAHASMVKAILQGTFNRKKAASAAQEQDIELIRRRKLRTRLTDEMESLLKNEQRMRMDNRQTRLTEQMESTRQRIQERKYRDYVRKLIMELWQALLDDKSSESEAVGSPHHDPIAATSTKEGATVPSSSGDKQHSHGIDEKEVPVESNSVEIVKIIASRRTKLESSMDARYNAAKEKANKLEVEARKEQLDRMEKISAQCHQRADLIFSRLERQAYEFGELNPNDVLTADEHWLVRYWSNESLQERLRLQDQRQKFLELTEASFKAVGGPQNMSQALKRSQDFAFIQFNLASLGINSEFVKLLVSIAKGVKSEFDLVSLDVDSEFDLALLGIDSEFVKLLVSIVADVKSEFDLASLDDNLKDLVSTVGGVKSEFIKYLVKSGSNLASLDVDSEFVKYLVSIVEGVKSVTGVSGRPQKLFKDPQVVSTLKSNVETAAEEKRDICSYTDVDVMVTDYYRKGWPYLLCRTRSALVCEVIFYTTAPKCDHIIRLRHTLVDDNARVNVDLNGSKLKPFRQQQNFNIEDIDLPKDHLRDDGQRNNLRITLDESSASAYWISDVFFPVEPKKSAQSDKS